MERKLKELEVDDDDQDHIFCSPQTQSGEIIHCNDDNDDDEKKKVHHLRLIVQNQDSTCREVDDLTLRRFLRARDEDVEKASRMFMNYHKWRQMLGSISESQIQNQIAHNKVFMQGTDKRGSPIGIIFGAKHFPSKSHSATDEFKRFAVFAFDKVCSRIPDGEEKFIVIADLKGCGYSNIDINGYIAALSIFQDYYPERLHKWFFVHAPYIFMTAYKILYPFIDKNIKKKIVFVESKKIHSTLLEEIDADQLPLIYGGKLDLVPIQDA